MPGYSLTVTQEKVYDEQIKAWLLELLEDEECIYGYRLLAKCIRKRYGVKLNNKRAYRLCKELGILQQARKYVPKYPRRLPKNHVITASNQLWQMYIKYRYVFGKERFFYVFSIIDVFDRVIVDQYRGTSCTAKDIIQSLERALERRIKPGEAMPIIRLDNGPQFVSKLFGDTCDGLSLVHERIPPRMPNMNVHIESFHSLLERHVFSKREFITFEEDFEALDHYLDFYNHRRMHGSLKDMPPMQFFKWIKTLEDSSAFYKAM